MTSVNISLTKEAYGYLKMLKGSEKSFSDVVLELKKKKDERGSAKSLLKFAGVLKHVDWEEREKRMKELRDSFNRRLGRRIV